jgi:protease IV
MSKSGKRALFVVGVLVAGLMAIAFMVRMSSQPAAGSVLELTLDDDIPDHVEVEGLSQIFGGRKLTMRDYLEALSLARDDRRIKGLLVAIDGPGAGSAKLQELRDAILDFQKGGKWAVAYLETAGEFSPGNRDYYLATSCGSIWLAPPGDINLTGMRAEPPFIRGTLDLLGIVPDMDHIGKYKSAMNTITDKQMNEAFRESIEALVGSIFDQVKQGIAKGRRMTGEQVAALIDDGPYVGPRALQAKLVDTLGYRDELEASLKEKNGGSLPLVKVGQYLKAGRLYTRGPKIALIYGLGGVARGENHTNPVTGEMTMGSDTTAEAIKKAREDDSIKAIVFRVDSPGGSYVASDVIYHQVTLTKGVKPIVVSMGDVAGSGGYFVAMGADKIVAEPATITASIGVLAGKLVTTGFWNKVGITFDAVQRGRHATFFSTATKYTPEEREIFAGWLDRIYKDFVGKAAKGRRKTYDEIHAVAQGRVWSGEDALRLGLVDEMGGLTAAISRALVLAHLDPAARVQIVVMPEAKSWFSQFWSGQDTRTPYASLQRQVRRLIEEGPSIEPDGVLSMPYVPVVH